MSKKAFWIIAGIVSCIACVAGILLAKATNDRTVKDFWDDIELDDETFI